MPKKENVHNLYLPEAHERILARIADDFAAKGRSGLYRNGKSMRSPVIQILIEKYAVENLELSEEEKLKLLGYISIVE